MTLEERILEKVFTEINDLIDAKVNKLTAKCIESENNEFSLDCEGNLSVNSISTRTGSADYKIPVDSIYPINSIYLSLSDTNPSALFGGVWEQIAKGRTIVGVDPSQEEFDSPKKTGGNKYLQNHNHYLNLGANAGVGSLNGGYGLIFANPRYEIITDNNPVGEFTGWGVGYTGIGDSENLQPYYTCYIWCRIA